MGHPRLRRVHGLLVLLLAAPLGGTTGVRADDGVPAGLTGSWVLVEDPASEAARERSIDAAVADMGFLFRGTARGRLMERTRPPLRVDFEVRPDRFEVSSSRGALRLVPGASPVEVSRGGEKGRVGVRYEPRGVVMPVHGAGGRTVTTWTLSQDGARLARTVELRAEKLAKPVVARASYRRSERAAR